MNDSQTLPSRRRILITGCGRSGTKYTAMLLRLMGFDVGHESLGADGIVSWYLAANCDSSPYGPGSQGLEFDHVFHQVRHPLQVIPSVGSLLEKSWKFVALHTGIDLEEPVLLRSARYWLTWNEFAERKAAWRYRIECLPTLYEEFCRRLGIAADPALLSRLPTTINARPGFLAEWSRRLAEFSYRRKTWLGTWAHRSLLLLGGHRRTDALTWQQLARLDSGLCEQIRQKAIEYGYEESAR